MTKIGVAAGFVAVALAFGISGTERSLIASLCAVIALCMVNRGIWSVGPSGFMVLATLGYFGLAISWSPDWQQGIHQLVLIAPFIVLYLVLSRADKALDYIPHAAGVSLIGALVLYQIFPGIEGGFGNRIFLAEFLISVLPFAFVAHFPAKGVVRKSVILQLISIASILWATWFLVFHSTAKTTAFAAILVAVVLSAWVWRHKGNFAFAVFGLAIGNVLVWAIVPKVGAVLNSVLARAELAFNTLFVWLDAPYFGNGSGSFNYAYPAHQEDHLGFFPDYSVLGDITMYAGAAHNEIAQRLAEHGIFGLFLLQLLALVLFHHWKNKEKDGLDYAAAWSLGLLLWLSLIGFPLHNPQTALVAIVSAAIIARGERAWLAGSGSHPVPAYIGATAGIAIVVATLLIASGQYRLNLARFIIEAKNGNSLAAFKQNAAAYDTWPYDQLTRRQLAMTTAKASLDFGKDLAIQPEAADRIYQISLSAGPDTPSTLLARADYLISTGRHVEKREEIEDILARLRKSSSRQPMTWIADTVYAANTGDFARAHESSLKMLARKYPRLPPEQIVQKAEEMFKELTR